MIRKDEDLVIIGGGVGGLVTTSVAAQLGRKVTLIEKEPQLGGDCLHYGCVPSKSLIHSAKVASLMRRGPEFGLPAYQPQVDFSKISQSIADIIAEIQKVDDPNRFRSYGAQVLFGDVQFIDPHHVEINGET
ncbi:MAG: FAD-dependent oxidoreductase, partial [Gammaproteobacteria bacterium]